MPLTPDSQGVPHITLNVSAMLQVAWRTARKLRASRQIATASQATADEPALLLGGATSARHPGCAARGENMHIAAVRIQAHVRGWLARRSASVRLQRQRLAARRARGRDWRRWQQATCDTRLQEAQLRGVRCLAAAEAAARRLETRMQVRASLGCAQRTADITHAWRPAGTPENAGTHLPWLSSAHSRYHACMMPTKAGPPLPRERGVGRCDTGWLAAQTTLMHCTVLHCGAWAQIRDSGNPTCTRGSGGAVPD